MQDGNTEAMFSSTYFDTDNITITIDVNDIVGEISPYIYGINSESDISLLTVNAIKQSDPSVSSYNWENNFTNSGTGTASSNGADLISNYPPGKWVNPALYTEYLVTKASRFNIPSKYVTLQMMGKVAADNDGDILSSQNQNRWNDISFSKTDSYMSQPDISDSTVYIDEYVSYLVNRYGYAVDGGINGYFLDNEPENWAERFPAAITEMITADELIEKSAQLSAAVKRIDPTALVYGPSISGIEAFTNLKNPDDWANHSREYSWFIDYYLMKMNEASRLSGTRLLDVLDVHYHTETTNGLFEQVIDGTDAFSNNTRMQAPRIFWDSTYFENSTIAFLNHQHIPLIPTLEASINMYYPGTKLSFSEYNFGAGNHISGGIATADTLGIFAEFGVHMACLKTNTENIDYHKAAINIYTNYDGMGSRFGDTIVKSDNGGDIMNSVYSAIDGNDTSILKTVLINKNENNPKKATIELFSDVEYETAEVYCFNSTSSKIYRFTEDIIVEDNSIEFDMEPLSVYMLVFSSSELGDNDNNEEELIDEEHPEEDDTEVTLATDKIPAVITTTAETMPPEHVSAETLSSAGTTVNIEDIPFPDDIDISGTAVATVQNEEMPEQTTSKESSFEDNIKVSKGFKTVVCILLGGVLIAMLYVVFSSGKKIQ